VIARIWRGWTTPENADAYQRIVSQEVLPGIEARNLDGYHGAYLLRRELDGEVEFATIMLFDSVEQVRAFAGEDYETAYVPPRARAVLVRFDERSAHYDMLLQPHMMGAGQTDLPKLAAPARRALLGAGYTRLEQLTEVSESEVMELHGMGPNALRALRKALEERGLSFRSS
jgi:hypothetical protein